MAGGHAGVLALAAVEEGVRLTAEAGIDAIRAKSIALTEFAIELLDERLAPLGCLARQPARPGPARRARRDPPPARRGG